MAPAMETIERSHHGALDVVLLNVDNPRWQPQVERFDVNGIPQLELFDAAGQSVGRSIGARQPAELEALTTALIEGKPLPPLAGVGPTSQLAKSEAESAPGNGASPPADAGAKDRQAAIGPRSHG
jgi:thioredoxin-like negative regulator of GroEL